VAQTVQKSSRQYPAPAPSPRHAGEGPSVSDPYPHDALYRRPAASPQASHLPRVGRCGRGGPRSVTSRRGVDFIGRWVSSSCFCAVPEGAASARGGVVPGSYSRHWWPVDGRTVVATFFAPRAGESSECKPDAGKNAGALPIPDCLDLSSLCPSVLIGFQAQAFNTL
jgi:hypothetical protein